MIFWRLVVRNSCAIVCAPSITLYTIHVYILVLHLLLVRFPLALCLSVAVDFRKKYKPKAAHTSYVLLYVVQVNRVVERGIHSQLDIIYIWVLVTLIVTPCADCCCFPIFVFHFFYILFHISIFLLESRAL